MKTAPFDLELAKLGHPLITRNGLRVLDFYHLSTIDCDKYSVACSIESFKDIRSYNHEGSYYMGRPDGNDLLLDLETPWEKPFELFESVLVKASPKADWRSMSFVCMLKDKFIVRGTDGYLETVSFCKRPDPIVEEKTTLDVEIKVGGQAVSLEDFKKLIDKL